MQWRQRKITPERGLEDLVLVSPGGQVVGSCLGVGVPRNSRVSANQKQEILPTSGVNSRVQTQGPLVRAFQG